MYIGDKLKNNPDDMISVMSDHLDGISEMYLDALALSFDGVETGEESHEIICVILAVCLLNDIHEVKFPLSYENGDEDLIAKAASDLNVLLLLDEMTKKKRIVKKRIDGEDVYSLPEENKE